MVYLRLAEYVLKGPDEKPPQPVTVTDEDVNMTNTDGTEASVQEPKRIEIDPTNPSFRFRTSGQLTQYYNKLHMMWSELQVIDLLGDEHAILQPKANYFHISNIPANYRSDTVYTLFRHLGSIQIRWINDISAWLIIRDDARIKDVVTGALGLDHVRQVLPSGDSEGKGNGITWDAAAEIQVQTWDQWYEENEKHKSITANTPEGEAIEADAVGQDQTEVQHLERATSAPPTNKRNRSAPETEHDAGEEGEEEDAEQDELREEQGGVDEEERARKRKRTEKNRNKKAAKKGKRRASANDAV
ncbi:hypothetical protein BC937DRAFT_94997 [Endogone sp. FLAS-F59071]|nr:hypothetical protein BC937DRAFT_94997 [Endogone sp. FLAS-F59071]|eukprot:RUS20526.1 hypothetical protein BC937DRAFT_94997 [Endogone sp. FLAS-F59071]